MKHVFEQPLHAHHVHTHLDSGYGNSKFAALCGSLDMEMMLDAVIYESNQTACHNYTGRGLAKSVTEW